MGKHNPPPYREPANPQMDVSLMGAVYANEATGTVLAQNAFMMMVKVDGGVEARFIDGQKRFLPSAATDWVAA